MPVEGGTAVRLRERLARVVRAEWAAATARWRRGSASTFDGAEPFTGPRTSTPDPRPGGGPPRAVPEQIRRYYANLELPVGATADEVKSAYRRLIRRYHPDRHREPSAQRAAAELARELRNAYEGLLRFLEDRQRPTGT